MTNRFFVLKTYPIIPLFFSILIVFIFIPSALYTINLSDNESYKYSEAFSHSITLQIFVNKTFVDVLLSKLRSKSILEDRKTFILEMR